jgi:hypothetical protein
MDTAQVNGLMVIIYNVKNKRQSKLFYGKFWTYSVYQFNWEVMSKKNIERGQGLGINKIATVLVKMEISIPEIKATVTRNYRKMSDQGNSNPAAGECDNYNCYKLPLTVDMCMFTVTVASINVKIFNVYGAIRGVYKTRLISVKDWLCYTWIFIKMDNYNCYKLPLTVDMYMFTVTVASINVKIFNVYGAIRGVYKTRLISVKDWLCYTWIFIKMDKMDLSYKNV